MHLFVNFTTLAFAALGLAAPMVTEVPAIFQDPDFWLAPTITHHLDTNSSLDDVPTDDCNAPYKMENHSTEGSPLMADCLRIADNIKKGGEWRVTAFQGRIASYKTCALGAEDQTGGVLTVGNLDLIDFIHASQQFQWFDKVGSSGYMDCRAFGDLEHRDTNPGLFTLYHTETPA